MTISDGKVWTVTDAQFWLLWHSAKIQLFCTVPWPHYLKIEKAMQKCIWICSMPPDKKKSFNLHSLSFVSSDQFGKSFKKWKTNRVSEFLSISIFLQLIQVLLRRLAQPLALMAVLVIVGGWLRGRAQAAFIGMHVTDRLFFNSDHRMGSLCLISHLLP